MRRLSLIAIDDDQLVLEAIKLAAPEVWNCHLMTEFNDETPKAFDLALVDIHLSDDKSLMEGIKVIEKLGSPHSAAEVIAISGDLSRDVMEKCLNAGASRFLAKPLSKQELVLTLNKVEALHRLRESFHRGSVDRAYWVGSGKASQDLKKQLAFLRDEAGPILIEGETGTGKEVATRILNQQEDHILLNVNVASIPENLFESEIFGHMKGSFSGANQNKIGMAEAAHGGDLFLDEIETLSDAHQAKLLRFLETGEVRPVGANKTRHVDVRVIAASNKPLERMVKDGQFREDLFWRLAKHHIKLPPLRERIDDIEELTDWFFSQDPARAKELSDDALAVMKSYNWPGNVRELRRVCEQLMLKAPLPIVRIEDVALIIRQEDASGSFEMDLAEGLDANMKRFEKQIIEECLKEIADVDKAAQKLKISRSSLYKKLKEHNIEWREA